VSLEATVALASDASCVSILTAVRDGLRHLDPAIESMRAQTLRAWQWVLVDDGSTDGTRDRLKRWAALDPRLEVVERPRAGLVAALNAGLRRCRAAIVARMDADDVAAPERLAHQLAALERAPRLTVVDSRVELIGGDRNAGMHDYVAWVNRHHDHASIAEDIFVESPLVHPAVCYRRDAVLEAGGYREGDFPEDYDLWLRLFRRGARFAKLEPVLLRWRDHPRRLTRSDRRYRTAAFTALKQRHLLEHEGDAMRGDGLVLWGAGRGTRSWRQWLRRRQLRPQFVIDANPRRRGTRVLGVPVVGAEALRERAWSYLLVTVSSPSSRAAIRRQLAAWSLPAASAQARVRFV
jgi:glycosyltransferase involved in cell wall biosynthesis